MVGKRDTAGTSLVFALLLDKSARTGDIDAMRLLRNIPLLLALVLALPWGAYLRVADASQAQAVVSIETNDTQAFIFQEDRASVSDASAAHRCRTATLPGFACAPPLILSAAASGDAPRSRGPGLLQPETGNWPGELAASPDTGPPRAV